MNVAGVFNKIANSDLIDILPDRFKNRCIENSCFIDLFCIFYSKEGILLNLMKHNFILKDEAGEEYTYLSSSMWQVFICKYEFEYIFADPSNQIFIHVNESLVNDYLVNMFYIKNPNDSLTDNSFKTYRDSFIDSILNNEYEDVFLEKIKVEQNEDN